MVTQTPPEPTSEPESDPSRAGTESEPAKPTVPVEARGTSADAKRGLIVLLVLVAIVMIVEAIGGDGEEQAAPEVSATPTQTASPDGATQGPEAPSRIQVEPGASGVQVSWEAPAGGSTVAGFLVSRNGELVATLDAEQLSFLDRKVEPNTAYSYTVAAFDADGYGSPPSASITVRTVEPDVGAAWLNGSFDVVLRETSHFGYVTFGEPPKDQRWIFAPTCSAGACPVDVTVRGNEDATVRLTPGQEGYRGSFSTDAFVQCDGVPVSTEVRIRLAIAGAEAVDDVWTATKVSGSVAHREAPQLACDASGTDFSVAGTAVG